MKKTRKRLFAFSALFLLIAQVLVMSLCNITAVAVTQSQNSKELFNNEHGSATISYEEAASGNLNWTVNLQKATNDVATRFMMDLTADGTVVIPENVKTSEQTNPEIQLQNINESGEKTGTLFEPTAGSISGSAVITFETTSDLANLKVKPKLMEVTEDGSDSDLLAENPGVVFDLATVASESTAASSTVASSDPVASSTATSSEQETVASSTTSEETVVESTVESTVDSSEATVDSSEAVTETTESTVETTESSDETTETQESTETSESTEASEADEELMMSRKSFSSVSIVNGRALPTGNQLVISKDIDNDINSVSVEVSKENQSGSNPKYHAYTKKWTASNSTGGYSTRNAWENNVYVSYGEVNGAKSVIFDSVSDVENAIVKVTYPEVGSYNGEAIGAVLTLSDFCVAANQMGHLTVPAIDFSSKLFSGMYYGLMTGLTVNVQFVKKGTTTPVTVNPDATYMTFASLNNAGKGVGGNGGWGSEFVIPRDTATAYQTDSTVIEYGKPIGGDLNSGAVDNRYPYGDTKAYFGNGEFGDSLSNPTYVNSAVSFQFGTGVNYSSSFSLGSMAGSAWTSFMSSLLVPIDPGAPDKRVTTSTTWNERDHDELDVLIKGQENVTVNKKLHHEYIINQPLYSVDQSIARPESITMTDTFPKYVIPTGQVTVIQASGEIVKRTVKTSYDEKNQRYTITFTLTDEEMKKVVFDGNDLTWVVDVDVSEKAIEWANKYHETVYMDNVANVSFNGENDVSLFTNPTNMVETQVIPDLKMNIEVEKVWVDEENNYKLQQPIVLQLQQSIDQKKWIKYEDFKIAPDAEKDELKHIFENVPATVQDGRAYYRVVEITPNGQENVYGYSDPVYSDERIISANNEEEAKALPVLQVTNTLLTTDFSFTKVGNDKTTPLVGVEFQVEGKNKAIDDTKEYKKHIRFGKFCRTSNAVLKTKEHL